MNSPFERKLDEKQVELMDNFNCSETLLHLAVEFIRDLQKSEEWPDHVVQSQVDQQKPDLYTLLESVTALRQEISLQGRSFHQLEQTLKQLTECPDSSKSLDENLLLLTQHVEKMEKEIYSLTSQSLKSEREAGREEGRHEAFSLLLDPLLDTHDQLRRLEEQNVSRVEQKNSWFFARFGKKREEDFLHLISLSLKKISQRLDTMNVISIAQCGMEFNPSTMKAVETEQSDSTSNHLVSEIYRQGYIHEERVIRFAEVKVTVPTINENSNNEHKKY